MAILSIIGITMQIYIKNPTYGMEFTNDGEVVLRHDNIEIELGEGKNLPIQLMNLGSILKELEGKSGVLYMKEFDSENSTASFKVR